MDTEAFENDINEFKSTMESFREEMKVKFNDIFKKVFKQYFDKYPHIEMITWAQYTPYFNDGEECIFGVGDPYAVTKKGYEDPENEGFAGYDWENAEDSVDYFATWSGPKDNNEYCPEAKDLRKIGQFLSDGSEWLKAGLGDHIAVKVFRDKIETQEYEHD